MDGVSEQLPTHACILAFWSADFPQLKPAEEIAWATPWLAVWGGYEPEVRADCHCAAVQLSTGWHVVDPLPLAATPTQELAAAAPVSAVVCLSGNHKRHCLEWAETHGCPLLASPEVATAFGWKTIQPLQPGPFGTDGSDAFPMYGGGPGELGLRIVRAEATWLMFADGLINLEPDGLALLPRRYCTDQSLLHRCVQSLLQTDFDGMTFGHGWPIRTDAHSRLKALIDTF